MPAKRPPDAWPEYAIGMFGGIKPSRGRGFRGAESQSPQTKIARPKAERLANAAESNAGSPLLVHEVEHVRRAHAAGDLALLPGVKLRLGANTGFHRRGNPKFEI
jgi:hypothetical protein